MADAIEATVAQPWRSEFFSGWAIEVRGYEHSPSVALDLLGSFTIADFITPEPGVTHFLLVNLDEEMRSDAPELLLDAIREGQPK